MTLPTIIKKCTECIKVCKTGTDEEANVFFKENGCVFDPGDVPLIIYLESGHVFTDVIHDGCDMGDDLKDTVCKFYNNMGGNHTYYIPLADIVALCEIDDSDQDSQDVIY